MPCNTVQRTTVAFKAENIDTLSKALASLGLSVREAEKGVLVFYGYVGGSGAYQQGRYLAAEGKLDVQQGFDVNALKRSYSAVVVEQAAKRFGWNVQKKDATHYAAQRRF
jgi:hypothetical protein